jgi:DNA polymerase-3 subunit delta'
MLAIHPATQKALDQLDKNLPQSLLLGGELGVGLFTIAIKLAGKNKAGEIFAQDAKGQRDDEGGTITVETIRRLYEQTRTKFTTRQIFIIDNAERMSHGAQNAFLKLLEEPNSQIHFILTSHHPQQLLPTIRSRVQQTVVRPITPEQSAEFVAALHIDDATKKTQLQFIAAGLPAELARLAVDDTRFLKRARIFSDARDFLQGDTYKKMLVIQTYKADRSEALQLLDSAMHILRRSVSAHPQPALITQLDRLLDVRERLSANQNIALQLARLVV